MEQVDIIVAALSAGALAGATATAESAVKGAYEALRARAALLLERRGRPADVLDDLEADDADAADRVRAELVAVGAEGDVKLVASAEALCELLSRNQEPTEGKYSVHVSGNVQGLAQGDHQQVSMTFSERSKT